MSRAALARLRAKHIRTVHLLEVGDTVQVVPPGTPDADAFTIRRIPAQEIRSDLLYSVLGRDGFVAYATWYNAEGQRHLQTAQANSRKPGDPEPFDDSLPDDATWRATSVALEAAAQVEILTQGMLEPTYDEAASGLGLYGAVLMRELVQWKRQAPEDPE